MLRSLKVTDSWLKKVKQALSRYDFSSQKALAEELEIPSRKVSDFFNGKSIEYEVFVAICARLGLDWQKVAKVPTEQVKNNNLSSQIQEPKLEIAVELSAELSKKMEDQVKKPEGIPKLASSLFRSFDSQDHIARKKIISTIPSITPSEQPSSQVREPYLDRLVDQVLTEQPAEKIIEEVIDEEAKVQDQRKDITSDPLLAISNQQDINQDITSDNQIQELLDINPDLPTIASDVLNPKTIAQIQELMGMDTNTNKSDSCPQVLEAPPHKSKQASREQAAVPQRIPEQEELKKTVPTINKVIESEPKFVSSIPDNLEPIFAAFNGSCLNQDWDTAAAIVNSINLTHIKKNSDLVLILVLYNQLLPMKWQDGEQKISDRLSHWQVLANAGMTAFYLEKHTEALAYYETALAIASILDTNTPLKIKAWHGLGMIYQAVAQYEKAIKYFQQSQLLAKEAQHHSLQLQALGNLGNIYYILRQYRTAIAYYQEFLELTETEKPHQDLIEVEFSTIGNLGNAYYNLKEYQKAINYQQKYLEIAQMTGNSEKEAGCLVSLGFSYYSVGLYQTAVENFHNARAIAEKYTYPPRIQISVFSGLGLTYQALKNYATAVVCFHKCLETAKKVGDRSSEVKALYNLRRANSYQHA